MASPQTNPFAEFGGNAVSVPQPSSDPFAEFGGSTVAPPTSNSEAYAKQFLQGAGNFFGGAGAQMFQPVAEAQKLITGHVSPYLQELATPPPGVMSKIGGAVENAGELVAGGALLEPLVGTGALANIGTQAGLGAASAAAHGGNPIAGALVGAGAEGVGQGLKALAPGVAASAIGVPWQGRMYGKTPEDVLLNDIPGLKVGTVAKNTQDYITGLNNRLTGLAARSSAETSTQPAVDVLNGEINKLRGQRANQLADAIERVKNEFFETNPKTGEAYAKNLTPSELLNVKRGFGKVVDNWNELNPKSPVTKALRQAYGALDSELDRAVPQGKEINQKLSSALVVKKRTGVEQLKAGTAQRTAHRIAAHTGALATADLGAYMGGPAGAVAGLVAPELVSSPAFKLAIARGLNAAPNFMRPVAIPLWNAMHQRDETVPLSALAGR